MSRHGLNWAIENNTVADGMNKDSDIKIIGRKRKIREYREFPRYIYSMTSFEILPDAILNQWFTGNSVMSDYELKDY